MKRSVVFYHDEVNRQCLVPSLTQLPNGDLYAVWCSGLPPEINSARYVMAARSADGGQSWSTGIRIVDTPGVCDINVTVLVRADGQLLLFYNNYTGKKPQITFIRTSTDGVHWSEPQLMPPQFGTHGAPVLKLPSGRILVPTHRMQKEDPSKYEAGCLISDDGGFNWRQSEVYASLDTERGAMEPTVIRRDDGELWMLVRTTVGYAGESVSHDDGVTWSPVQLREDIVTPQAPLRMVKLPDGAMVLVWNYGQPFTENTHFPRDLLVYAVSRDDGRTFSAPVEIHRIDDSAKQWAGISYPSPLVLGDSVVLIYHYHYPDWRSVGDILCVALEPEELVAGE